MVIEVAAALFGYTTTAKGPGSIASVIHYATRGRHGGGSSSRPLLHFDQGVEQACSASVWVFLPTAHYLGNPYVRVQHITQVRNENEVAATPARLPAEPVFSTEVPPSLRPRSTSRLRFFLQLRVPGLAGGFRREVDENCTDTFSEDVRF